MSILQAFQADLLRDIDEGGEPSADEIKYLQQAADLSLWATNEMDKSIGHSLGHLRLNLSGMKEKR